MIRTRTLVELGFTTITARTLTQEHVGAEITTASDSGLFRVRGTIYALARFGNELLIIWEDGHTSTISLNAMIMIKTSV